MYPLRTPVLWILQTLRSLTIAESTVRAYRGGLAVESTEGSIARSRVAGSPYRVLQCPLVTTRSWGLHLSIYEYTVEFYKLLNKTVSASSLCTNCS